MSMPGHLVAILHSLPAGDGSPSRARVDSARRALGCGSSSIVNLYPKVLAGANLLNQNVGDPGVWASGRSAIRSAILAPGASDVLLGYGLQLPSGAGRQPFREQLRWLSSELSPLQLRLWTFGGRPAHPSRWQRVSHRHRPGATIDEVAQTLLVQAVASDIDTWLTYRSAVPGAGASRSRNRGRDRNHVRTSEPD